MKNIRNTLSVSLLVAAISSTSLPVLAHQNDASMDGMQGQGMGGMQGHNKGGMPMMEMMKERQAMMQEHMGKMETSLSNIEALLQQLVDLQKN